MAEIWVDRLPLSMGDLYVDVTPDRFALIPADTGFTVLTFEVSCGDHQSEFKLLVPFDGLDAHSTAFKPKQKEVPTAPTDSLWEPQLRSSIPNVPVEVRGTLSSIDTTIRSLLAMKVGTLIPIEEPDAMTLALEQRVVAKGRYGAHDGYKAMQFTGFKEQKS